MPCMNYCCTRLLTIRIHPYMNPRLLPLHTNGQSHGCPPLGLRGIIPSTSENPKPQKAFAPGMARNNTQLSCVFYSIKLYCLQWQLFGTPGSFSMVIPKKRVSPKRRACRTIGKPTDGPYRWSRYTNFGPRRQGTHTPGQLDVPQPSRIAIL